MKLAELARELKLNSQAIQKFIHEFNLELGQVLTANMEVTKDFEKFAREQGDFLHKFEEDLTKDKSAGQIAETLEKPVEEIQDVINKSNIYDNGPFRSSVSTFGVDRRLGGNYHFVYDYFGKKTELAQRDFIGYRDLYFYIAEQLEPFIDPQSARDWGIRKPAGIVLYGPPGSGKIFWANKIAEVTGYKFKEVKKQYLGTSFVNGNKTSFNDFLIAMLTDEKVLLFVENFDEIMAERAANQSVISQNEETKDIVLHNIDKFAEEELLMVGSALSLKAIDSELQAPGRFDVLIPVFPPNQQERSEMILYHLTKDLNKDALLMKILENNEAGHVPFWKASAEKMKVFSNTMVKDFTQSLKRRLKNSYQKEKDSNIKIGQNLLDSAFRDAATKLTDEYLNQVGRFIHDVSVNNYDDFSHRIDDLKKELNSYRVADVPRRVIGFTHNEEDGSNAK